MLNPMHTPATTEQRDVTLPNGEHHSVASSTDHGVIGHAAEMIASGNIAVVAGTNETSSSSSSSLPTTSSVAPVAPVAATLYETSTLSENANVAVKTDAFVKTKRHTYVNVDDNSEGGSGTATAAAAAAAAAAGAGAEVRVMVARAEATAPNSAVKIDTFMKSKRHTYINLDEDLNSMPAARAGGTNLDAATPPLLVAQQQQQMLQKVDDHGQHQSASRRTERENIAGTSEGQQQQQQQQRSRVLTFSGHDDLQDTNASLI
eukprot:gene25275-26665_t